MKRKILSILLALALCVGLTVAALAGGDGIAEITIEIKDANASEAFALTPQDLTGDFIFTNEQGDTVTFPVAFMDAGRGRLFGWSFFLDEDSHEWAIFVKSPGVYKLTQYPALPQGYSFVISENSPQSFHLDGLEPFQGTFKLSLLVESASDALSPTAPPPASDNPSSWAAEQVNAAVNASLVPDSLQSKYTQATTRAEFCALAMTLYENIKGEITWDPQATFTDTDDINVKKAADLNIVNGLGDNLFDPDSLLTREQAATMLKRLSDALGNPLYNDTLQSDDFFSDRASISSWAVVAVECIQANGIMNGVGNNEFSPKADYTREQSIVTIMRLYDIVK